MANALENNVNLYKYVDGRRSDLKDGHAKVESGKWQELCVEARGQTLRGFLNGQPVVETMDPTFSSAGGVGLWTKADSQTCFDDVEVSCSICLVVIAFHLRSIRPTAVSKLTEASVGK